MNIQPNLLHPIKEQTIGQSSDISEDVTNQAIGKLSGQITGILDGESQNIFDSKNEQFNILLEELRFEVERIRRGLGNTKKDIGVYSNRFCQGDEFVNSIIKGLLITNHNLSGIYNGILELFPIEQLKQLISSKIYIAFFEDLAYEYMVSDDLEELIKLSLTDDHLIGYFFEDSDEENINMLKDVKILSFYNYSLKDAFNINKGKMIHLFSSINNLKKLTLTSSGLNQLSDEELSTVFSNLNNLKVLDISWNSFTDFDKDKFNIMFSNLNNIKLINFESCNMQFLSINILEFVLSKLFRNPRTIYINFGDMDLFTDDQKELINSYYNNGLRLI